MKQDWETASGDTSGETPKEVNQLTKRCALEHEKHQSTVSHCIKWLEVVEEQYSLGLIGRGEYLNKVISTADTLRNQSVQMKERS